VISSNPKEEKRKNPPNTKKKMVCQRILIHVEQQETSLTELVALILEKIRAETQRKVSVVSKGGSAKEASGRGKPSWAGGMRNTKKSAGAKKK